MLNLPHKMNCNILRALFKRMISAALSFYNPCMTRPTTILEHFKLRPMENYSLQQPTKRIVYHWEFVKMHQPITFAHLRDGMTETNFCIGVHRELCSVGRDQVWCSLVGRARTEFMSCHQLYMHSSSGPKYDIKCL